MDSESSPVVAGAVEKVEISLRLRDFQAQWKSPALGLFRGAAFSTALLPPNCAVDPEERSSQRGWRNSLHSHGRAGGLRVLSQASTTSTGTALNWSAASAPSNCSVTSYTIYKNGTSIGTATNTNFVVTGLSASTTYSFTVAASDSAGTSSQSSSVSVTTGTTGSQGTPPGTYTIIVTGTANGAAVN